jgi:hypothetical protein
MPQDAERDQRFIKYLLGELLEPERTQLEDEYLGHAETFKKLVTAEKQIIDAYLRGALSPSQLSHFERLFLPMPEGRSRPGVC